MSRLSRELAQRIDRLSRYAHAFHRAAHHPLCPPYQSEVLRLGRRIRICRGCVYVAIGTFAGLCAGLLSPPVPPVALACATILLAVLGRVLLATRSPHRRSKFLTRFTPAALGGAIVSSGLSVSRFPSAGCAIVAIAVVFYSVRVYRRRGPDRSPCATCPDRNGVHRPNHTCAGFLPIVRREAAFRRLAGRWIRTAEP